MVDRIPLGRIAVALALLIAIAAGFVLLTERTVESPDLPTPSIAPSRETNASTPAPTVAEREAAIDPAAAKERFQARVVSATDMQPVSGVAIGITASMPRFVSIDPLAGDAQSASKDVPLRCSTATSGENGNFEIFGERVVGYLESKDPFHCVDSAVFIDAAQRPMSGNVVLVDAGVVSGRVVTKSGDPIANAKLRLGSPIAIDIGLLRTPIRRAGETTSDSDGKFEFVSVPAGIPLELTIDASGYPKEWREVEVHAALRHEFTIRLDEGSRLIGRVRAENGMPIPGARVTAREISVRVDAKDPQKTDGILTESTTDGDGRFQLRGLLPGRYIVIASHSDFVRSMLDDVTVPAGTMQLPTDFVLRTGARIEGVVVDAKGDPIPSAELGLRRTTTFGQNGMGFTPKSAETMGGWRIDADADGRFRSPPLPTGTFDIVASKTGYVQAQQTKVAPGRGEVRLTLKKRGGIEGIVVAAGDGHPIVEFEVAALRPFDMQSLLDPTFFEHVRHAVVVHNAGRFLLEDVAPGKYTLTVTANGFARSETLGVVVKEDEVTRDVHVTLQPEATIRGVVVDKGTGSPLSHVRITTRQGMAAMMPDPLALGVETQTDARGEFTLTGLAAGKYTLAATRRTYAPGSSEAITLVTGETREGLKILLAKGARLSGRVLRKNGEPVVGAMLTANQLGSYTPAVDTTDGDGNYLLEGLAAGSYSVTLLPDVKVGSEDMTADMLRNMQTRSVKLKEADEQTLDFTIETNSGITLEGTVTQNREPLANVMLSFVPNADGANPKGKAGEAKLQIANTDHVGHYTIDGLAAGKYTVAIQSMADFSHTVRQNFEIELGTDEQQHRDFDVSATGLEGRVTRADDHSPLSGIRVSVDAVSDSVAVDAFSKRGGGKRAAEVVTASDGTYRITGMAPGSYSVVAGGTAPFYLGGGNFAASEPRAVTLVDGKIESGVDIELTRGAVISGSVHAEGQPAASASLFFWKDGNPDSTRDAFSLTLTDAAGNFKVDGLDPGTYVVIAKASGFAPAWKTQVSAVQDKTTTVELELVRGAELVLRVIDGQQQDLTASARFGLMSFDGVDLSRLVTLEDVLDPKSGSGGRSFGPIAPGNYPVTVKVGATRVEKSVSHGAVPETVTLEIP